MLFHVTRSHTVDNCPIYHKDGKEMSKMIEAAEGLEGMAGDLKVKIHKILDSDIFLDDIIGCSVEHFERYHTSEKRTEEFLQYISDVVHD